jgi:hypothetical protein
LTASRGWHGVDPETVWQISTVVIGSSDQIRKDLAPRRERYRLTYIISSDDDLTTLTKIIAGL